MRHKNIAQQWTEVHNLVENGWLRKMLFHNITNISHKYKKKYHTNITQSRPFDCGVVCWLTDDWEQGTRDIVISSPPPQDQIDKDEEGDDDVDEDDHQIFNLKRKMIQIQMRCVNEYGR